MEEATSYPAKFVTYLNGIFSIIPGNHSIRAIAQRILTRIVLIQFKNKGNVNVHHERRPSNTLANVWSY